MSTLQAAPAASAERPRRTWTIGHRALTKGHFVRMSIPAQSHLCDDRTEGGVKALCFDRQVANGYLNLYVLDEDPIKYRGQSIFVEATVMEETLNDGRIFIAVHLRPVPHGAGEVSRMYVLAHDPEDWRLYPTPECIVRTVGGPSGFVAFVSPGQARLQSNFVGSRALLQQVPIPFVEKEPEAQRVPARSSSNTKSPPEGFVTTGDSQLDRLLRAGWEISTETHDDVHLWKMKGTERVEMTHFKPRRKSGNGKKR